MIQNNRKDHRPPKIYSPLVINNGLRHLAFDNFFHANIICNGASGEIIVVNRAASKLLCYSKRSLITKCIADIFDITESNYIQMIKQRDAKGKSAALVTAFKKNRQPISCEITSSVFKDENGIEQTIITVADIGKSILRQKNIDAKKEKIVTGNIILAQKKSDERLLQNNEWIKTIAKTSYDVMWDYDISSGNIYVGDSVKEVFGYKVQNNLIRFKDFSSCLLPEEKEVVKRNLLKAFSSGNKSWSLAYKLKRCDGSVASTTSRASIIRDEKGKAIRMIGAIQDVSKLQYLEKQLQEQIAMQEQHNEKFSLAAKLSSDIIWDWNLLTNEVFIGEGYEELFGYSLENNKCNIADKVKNIHPNDKKAVKKGLYDTIASTAANWEHAYRFIKADGSISRILDRGSIFRHPDGKAHRMIGAMQDLTEIKKLEKEKELIIKELMKSNANLMQFSYIISHNLRSPLANIESILNIIDYSNLDTNNSKLLKLLKEAASQLTKTIKDVIKIMVIKNDVNISTETINLDEAFVNQNKIFSSAIEEVQAKVLTKFTESYINFNGTYLESILINLFSNAIKYRSLDRSLIIQASSEKDNDGNIIFRFSDNGTGIDLNRHKDRIFGLYQRFHNTVEGQGLGLYIIKSQIEALNGKIEIESQLDKGTTFILTFQKKPLEREL